MTTTGAGAVNTIPGANDGGDAVGTTTTQQSLIAASGSGEFMGTVGIIGGASIFALGLIMICCKKLITFTSAEQRQLRLKAEHAALQKEQERLQKALLEMNSSEGATQRRADRERQKLVEKMGRQEEARVRNERLKEKRLKELAYELKKQGTGIVVEGFDDSDDDDVPGAPSAAAAAAASGGGGDDDGDSPGKDKALERARQKKEQEAKIKEDLNPDADDADEGDAILSVPPPAYTNDANFFKSAGVNEAARLGRLVPTAEQQRYHKPWEQKPQPKQRFVPGLAVRRVIPPTAEECPKAPVVVYDEEKDDFVYVSHDEHQRRLAEERARGEASAVSRDKSDRDRARKGLLPNFDEVDDGGDAAGRRRLPELPPVEAPWTDNSLEVPLARAHTGVRAATDVKLEKPRWTCEEADV